MFKYKMLQLIVTYHSLNMSIYYVFYICNIYLLIIICLFLKSTPHIMPFCRYVIINCSHSVAMYNLFVLSTDEREPPQEHQSTILNAAVCVMLIRVYKVQQWYWSLKNCVRLIMLAMSALLVHTFGAHVKTHLFSCNIIS